MTIMQLAGFPAEVVDSVVSVLSRMAFDFGLWSDGASPLLFVCEEAHRYAPAEDKTIFSQPPGNTSQSFSASVLNRGSRSMGTRARAGADNPLNRLAFSVSQSGNSFNP